MSIINVASRSLCIPVHNFEVRSYGMEICINKNELHLKTINVWTNYPVLPLFPAIHTILVTMCNKSDLYFTAPNTLLEDPFSKNSGWTLPLDKAQQGAWLRLDYLQRLKTLSPGRSQSQNGRVRLTTQNPMFWVCFGFFIFLPNCSVQTPKWIWTPRKRAKKEKNFPLVKAHHMAFISMPSNSALNSSTSMKI